MAALPGGAVSFLAVSIVAFVVLGSVLEGIPAIVLFGPLLFPIARQIGIHEVHYAMVVILAMGIGLFAPPFGVGYYAACAIGRVHPDEGMRPIVGYMLALLVGTIVVAAVPWISISQPRGASANNAERGQHGRIRQGGAHRFPGPEHDAGGHRAETVRLSARVRFIRRDGAG